MRRFAEFCTVKEEEASSWHDDVALSVSLRHGRQGCAVWMSYVAPYAVIHVGRAVGQPLRDTDFVHAGGAGNRTNSAFRWTGPATCGDAERTGDQELIGRMTGYLVGPASGGPCGPAVSPDG